MLIAVLKIVINFDNLKIGPHSFYGQRPHETQMHEVINVMSNVNYHIIGHLK